MERTSALESLLREMNYQGGRLAVLHHAIEHALRNDGGSEHFAGELLRWKHRAILQALRAPFDVCHAGEDGLDPVEELAKMTE